MIKNYILLFVSILLFAGCSKNEVIEQNEVEVPQSDVEIFLEAEWETIELSESIDWKYYHFDDLFSSNQSITIFDINLNSRAVEIEIPFVESGFLKTSEAAKSKRAIAAINGSYFNTSTGGSTVFFKKDNRVVNTTKNGFTNYRENGGFGIHKDGSLNVYEKPSEGWESLRDISTLLVGGPLLIFDDKIVEQVQTPFNSNRHPRTAVGITDENHLIALVVDGRSSESYGMTIEELGIIMEALGCSEAINMDGGGSSTAFVQNRGVVNYPSDNKKFDHEGERGVATVITFSEE